MSEKPRAAKTRANVSAESKPDGEAADVVEAIKAMQMQLADLRKLVQAARTPGDTAGTVLPTTPAPNQPVVR